MGKRMARKMSGFTHALVKVRKKSFIFVVFLYKNPSKGFPASFETSE